jgi:hypothetical protein
MNDNAPILRVDQLLHNASTLSVDGNYALAVIAACAFCTALLYGAERWGAARARRRTARAIAAIEPSRPPEAQT